jgi:hypothetical protein
MTRFFMDASAIVKRYSAENGSAWIMALTAPAGGHSFLLAEITLAEVAAAFAAKHRAPKGIPQSERDNALFLFLNHCKTEYDLVAIKRFVIDRAVVLTQTHKLRGYDAVQLAAALIANDVLTAAGLAPLVFVAADDDLVTAARAEGLTTDNPNLHP